MCLVCGEETNRGFGDLATETPESITTEALRVTPYSHLRPWPSSGSYRGTAIFGAPKAKDCNRCEAVVCAGRSNGSTAAKATYHCPRSATGSHSP